MTDEKIIEILRELWRYEHTEKYTDDEIRFACEFAISKIYNYQDLLTNYMKLLRDFRELRKHPDIPIRDNY